MQSRVSKPRQKYSDKGNVFVHFETSDRLPSSRVIFSTFSLEIHRVPRHKERGYHPRIVAERIGQEGVLRTWRMSLGSSILIIRHRHRYRSSTVCWYCGVVLERDIGSAYFQRLPTSQSYLGSGWVSARAVGLLLIVACGRMRDYIPYLPPGCFF